MVHVSARRAAAAAVILFLCLPLLASCGGSGESSDSSSAGKSGDTSGTPAPAPRAVIATADANCRALLRAVARVGREAQHAGYETAAELTTKGFAEPGLKLFKELARQQRQLQAEAGSAAFEAYADSFDPIIVLAEQWLQAQRTKDSDQVERLQQLLTDLGAEQQVLAAEADLPKCSINFLDAMVRSANS
jgi:hypothetical protein